MRSLQAVEEREPRELPLLSDRVIVSGDGWPVREACVVRVLGGGEKNKWTAVNLGVGSRDIRVDIETDGG
jgi:hypothetical protein